MVRDGGPNRKTCVQVKKVRSVPGGTREEYQSLYHGAAAGGTLLEYDRKGWDSV